MLNKTKVQNYYLKSENKKLRYELEENLENLKEQATRWQKFIAENGTLKKALLLQSKNKKVNFCYYFYMVCSP